MQPLNILVIEDDVLTARDIEKTLKSAASHDISLARSYDEAVSSVIESVPDLIVLDINLQKKDDGIAAAREILSKHSIPIVVLTASTEDSTYKKAREVFVPSAYLTKPFRHVDLPRIVDLAWQNFHAESTASTTQSDSVFLPVEKGFDKILKSDVLYITTQKGTHCTYVYEVYKKEPKLVQLPMGYLEQYFGLPHFYRISRSLILNIGYIERVEGLQIKLQGSATLLTIPEISRADLLKRLSIIRGPKK